VAVRLVTDAEAAIAQARAEAEHGIRAVAEHAPIGIILSEAGIRLGFVNAAFAALLDRPTTALLGQGWLQVIHPEDRQRLQTALEQVLTGQPGEVTVRLAADPHPPDHQAWANPRRDDVRPDHPLHAGPRSRWLQFRLVPVTTPRRAAGFVATVEDVTDARARDAVLTYQAYHDPLTGLANRRRLIETLTSLLDSQRGADREIAVLFCDLNGFKQVNDAHGHEAGDLLLIEVARRLTGIARQHDLVARLAGDEFVILLSRVRSDEEAAAAAARYQAALATTVRIGGHQVTISATVGVARPHPGDTPTSLLQAADQIMYRAKRQRTAATLPAQTRATPNPDPTA
jgi:diguanylate cyclase (GGDEF)-like protein